MKRGLKQWTRIYARQFCSSLAAWRGVSPFLLARLTSIPGASNRSSTTAEGSTGNNNAIIRHIFMGKEGGAVVLAGISGALRGVESPLGRQVGRLWVGVGGARTV